MADKPDTAGTPEGLPGLAPSAEEAAYFESGGQTQLPGADTAEGGADTQAGEGEEDGEQRSGEPLDIQLARTKAALAEARADRRAARREATQLRSATERLDQLHNAIAQMQGGQPGAQRQQPTPPPDWETNFSGRLKYELEQQGQTVKGLADVLKGQQAQTQQQAQFMGFISAYDGATRQFRQATPDYDDAFDFAREQRGRQLEILGHDEAEIESILNGEEEFIARRALQSGENPASRFYELAKLWGFQGGSKGNGAAKHDLATIRRGQGAARSLGAAGGSAPPGQLTLEAIAAMPPGEFNALLRDPAKLAKLDAVMGKAPPPRGRTRFFN